MATYTDLISAQELVSQLNSPNLVILDCRSSLDDKERGKRDYLNAHIPNAFYAHLDDDLSSPIIAQETGRHPLPDVEALKETLSNWGIDEQTQVIAYDDGAGMIAARAWWLLKWLGHEKVAVLDGGWSHWSKEGLVVTKESKEAVWKEFSPNVQAHLLVSTEQVTQLKPDRDCVLLDARSADRFQGENETIDPVAGHIPGAVSAPFMENVNEAGLLKTKEVLQKRFTDLLGDKKSDQSIVYCGSGVTACHNLLAMHYCGLGDGKLYAGSWSEWITDPTHPIAT